MGLSLKEEFRWWVYILLMENALAFVFLMLVGMFFVIFLDVYVL